MCCLSLTLFSFAVSFCMPSSRHGDRCTPFQHMPTQSALHARSYLTTYLPPFPPLLQAFSLQPITPFFPPPFPCESSSSHLPLNAMCPLFSVVINTRCISFPVCLPCLGNEKEEEIKREDVRTPANLTTPELD